MTLPEPFKKSVQATLEAGWDKIGIEEALGGTPMPKALVWALHEHILGANPAVWMYGGGAGFANILYKLGTEEQKKWAMLAAERNWGATMVLTEPDAGSDVGAARTKAIKQDDGSWHIDGVKRFITSADSGDLFENIFHLVLARPEGAGRVPRVCRCSSSPSSCSTRKPVSHVSATACSSPTSNTRWA
ncbi:acyl-CoA dehydrogenase, N-terminal domain protein [Mycobacterium xenopi 3993]|nr:acyl-CoA dehydrogenase, N-terminal domain protein [Mycobacterium xenopi 3993]